MRIRKSILLPLGLCLLCAVAPASFAARRGGVSVKGRVTQSGSPLASSMVKLYYPKSWNRPTLVTFTDKNGYYGFDPVEPNNSYLLEVYAGNELIYQNKLWVDGSRPVFEQNVTLNRADTSKVLVQYYPKSFDRERIEAAMNEVSGRFNVRRGRTEVGDTPTNAIWFGENVSLDDIKAVALALAGKGVEIKSIRPFRARSAANESQIQVGAYRTAANSPTWTADKIRGVGSKSAFPR